MSGRSDRPRKFFSDDEQKEIVAAIGAAELRTSGEIRLHVERDIPKKAPAEGDPYLRARQLFAELGMHATEARNGVLFYLATRSRRFCVLGDEQLHEKVGEQFWEDVVARMAEHFAGDRFGEGMATGIAHVGESLSEHFPYLSDDVNELPDEISFED